ncbi:MAG: hypothetical protein Q8P56_04585 [Candidatus Uhrbacteria bacterium]|nr:hypothetical protein [Candidatus Uhrbacteria bacterium]
MPRVRLLTSPEKFFSDVRKRTGFTFEKLGEICGVHRRSFSDWKSGELLMPSRVFEKIIKVAVIERPKYKVLPDYWHIRDAASKGGTRRLELYGPPGTFEGRKKGGRRTREFFLANPALAAQVGFKLRKEIVIPPMSTDLAEMVGIMLGDGGITQYQAIVTLNSVDDRQYVDYVAKLFKKLFRVEVDFVKPKNSKAIDIRVSNKNLVEYFIKKHSLSIGSKIRAQVTIPSWIEKRDRFLKACLRGLFDTDGSFYIDRHKIKEKSYKYPCLVFASNNATLYGSMFRALQGMNLCPTGKQSNIFLRREENVHRYFRVIGSSNKKHLDKYRKFVKNK